MYDKLTKSDQLKYNILMSICNECKGHDNCKQEFRWQRPMIIQDKIFKTYRLSTIECTKKWGFIVNSKYKRLVEQVPKYHATPLRNSIIKKIQSLDRGFLYGKSGNGKTTLMRLIANDYMRKGHTVLFDSGLNITEELKDFSNDSTKSKLDKYQDVEMLFIDDMFRENITQYTIMNIYNAILQYRIDNSKPTFLSSNYSIGEIENIIEKKVDKQSAEAIRSRLRTLGVHRLDEKDYRMESEIPDL